MKQMNKLKLSAVAVLLSLSYAEAVLANQPTFAVSSFQLSGDVQALSDGDQIALAQVLEPFQGEHQTFARLKEAQKAAQAKLDELGKSQYQIILPEQALENGSVQFQMVYRMTQKGQIVYRGSEGYGEENIANSIPSLKEGKFYEDGRQWFDRREFNMAQENPLKVTRMHYELDPQNKVSDLTVAGFSPFGSKRAFIAIDNYGSREFKRGRINLGYVNANLSGHDDVLSLMALSNFKEPSKSFAMGLSYSRPFYDYHQSLSFQLGYSNLDSSDSDGLPSLISRKMVHGKTTFVGINWNYYLPSFDLGIEDQFKINAAYSYRHYHQSSSLTTSFLGNNVATTDKSYSIAGVSLGLSGEVKITPNAKISMELTDYYYANNLPGSKHMERLGEGFNRSYNIVFYRLGYSQDFAEGWNFNSQLTGQYSRQDLSNIDSFSVTGIYAVRGFKYASVNGDRGLVWRNEISMPKYTKFKVSPYAFFDLGQYRYNKVNAKTFNDNKVNTITSTGLGLRAEIVKNMNMDVFVARRLANAEADNLNNNRHYISDRTTLWGRVTYSF